MRAIVGAAVTCLSITTLAQSVNAQVPGESQRLEASTLEEIVVTAQKREERLQDVPISISVLGGDTLDSSSDRGVIDAVNRVPGVIAPVTNQGGRSGGTAMIAIRGVSSPSVGSGTTGYYLDSIPFGRAKSSIVPDASPYDLDRVEVLRGPQGTLYGASALNGVVRVLTRNPDFQNLDFKVRGSLSSTQDGSESYSGDAAFNMPLIEDKLAARVALGYQELGGWIDKPNKADANDTETSNVRVKLAAKPTDNFTVGLSGWFSRSDNGAPPFTADGLTNASALDESTSTDFDIFSLDLNYDAGLFAIKSTTSYIDYTLDSAFDFSAFAPNNTLVNRSTSTVLTEELLLNSAGDGPWRWTLGAMYRDAQDDTFSKRSLAMTAPDIYFTESKSVAVFGELTRAFADGQFEVTGGLRYFRDEVRDWETSRGDTATGVPPEGLQSIENTFKKTTPRVVLSWHPSDDSTLYASYSKGFRSGINQNFAIVSAVPGTPPAKPDTITNYEIGGKARLGRFIVDTAVYYIDWEDPQQNRTVLINNLPYPLLDNGDSISGIGTDLAVVYSPISSLALGVNFGWNDLTFDADVYSGPVIVSPAGTRRTNSPKTTAGAFVDYSLALGGSGFRGRMSASGNYTSEQISNIAVNSNPITGVTTVSRYMADSMTIARVSFALEAPKNWTATLFMDNATDEEGMLPDSFSPQYNTAIRPRTYGVQFEYRYK